MARLLTPEQHQFLENNVKGVGNQELTDLINEKFGTDFSMQQIKTYKKNHNLSSGLTGHFPKGHVPINKGTKGMFNVGGNKTSFKKGLKPHNLKEIGYERLDRDGYLIVKVSSKGRWDKRWVHKHKIVWEKENGPIPEGHVVSFLDGDKTNVSIDNLVLLTRREHLALTRNGMRFKDKELTKTGIALTRLSCAVQDKQKAGEES